MGRPKGSKNVKEVTKDENVPMITAISVYRKANGYYSMVTYTIQNDEIIDKKVHQESTQSDFFSRMILKFQDMVRKLNKKENQYGKEYYA